MIGSKRTIHIKMFGRHPRGLRATSADLLDAGISRDVSQYTGKANSKPAPRKTLYNEACTLTMQWPAPDRMKPMMCPNETRVKQDK